MELRELPSMSGQQSAVEKLDPWFDDGNIIIACEGKAVFRVHKGVMARHSEVFRNLFADAEAQSDSTVIEGCPVMELGDTIGDCQKLILAFYEQVTFDLPDVDGFLYLSSLLQSATKYCVDWLRKLAINHLKQSWPTTLQTWESFSGPPWPIHPALVINLARKADAHIFLPVALCCLGQLPVVEALELDLSTPSGPIELSAYRLSTEDDRNYTRYLEQRATMAHNFIKRYIDGLHVSDCSTRFNSQTCLALLRNLKIGVRDAAIELRHSPLGIIHTALRFGDTENKLCANCRSAFSAGINRKKQELWDALPGWFSLPAWDVLRSE